jgi:hypothetical protein
VNIITEISGMISPDTGTSQYKIELPENAG